MAESTYLPGLAVREAHRSESARFSAMVRVTHWINALSFFGLLISGFAILLAHPHLYWGETGGLGGPTVMSFPLPTMKGGPSGWGRRLHFLSAWVCILTGIFYVVSGALTRHFRRHLLPQKQDLSWRSIWRVASSHLRLRRPPEQDALSYNVLQRLTYLAVIFVLFPLLLWTAFAMSPAIVSIFPGVVTSLGGQETARTLHFFVSALVVLFFLVHIAMLCLAGFVRRVTPMITGERAAKLEHP